MCNLVVSVNEVEENEYEDYSLPIDIQNTSNIYEVIQA